MFDYHPDKHRGANEITYTQAFQYLRQCVECLESGQEVPEYYNNSYFTEECSARSSWFSHYWQRHRSSYRDDDFSPRGDGRGGSGGSGGGEGEFKMKEDPLKSYARYQRDQPPHPYLAMARRWQTQARFDVEEAERHLDDPNNKGN